MDVQASLYLIALGSNRRHASFGNPRAVIARAIESLSDLGTIRARSDVMDSAPVGPSARQYANAALILESEQEPEALLDQLQAIEREFGTRRGQRWSSRVLDLDIILWNRGVWASPLLTIPHPLFRERDFVLGPATQIAGDWRDPITTLLLRQLNTRLTNRRPLTR